MADMEQLARELLVHHPERWVRHHLASFPVDYFRVFDCTEVSRHLEAMLNLSDDRPVHVRAEPSAVASGELMSSATTHFSFSQRCAPYLRCQGCR